MAAFRICLHRSLLFSKFPPTQYIPGTKNIFCGTKSSYCIKLLTVPSFDDFITSSMKHEKLP